MHSLSVIFLSGKSRLSSVKGTNSYKVNVRSFFKLTVKISEAIKCRAHLQDFDFLAKKDLRLGQVLLINALDGHLPICLLWNTESKDGEDREI